MIIQFSEGDSQSTKDTRETPANSSGKVGHNLQHLMLQSLNFLRCVTRPFVTFAVINLHSYPSGIHPKGSSTGGIKVSLLQGDFEPVHGSVSIICQEQIMLTFS